MPSLPTNEFVNEALSHKTWDTGNQVLYDLCGAYPDHSRDDIIIAKVWIIGRTYAAAIERRHTIDVSVGDAFYEDVVAPKIRSSGIDNWLRALVTGSNDDVALILETHERVKELFNEISGLEKRSLASKYLHFHFPERFYIYDSRAAKAIARLTTPIGRNLPSLRAYDNVYARFFLRCKALNKDIVSNGGQLLLPRELDKVLLEYSRKQVPEIADKQQWTIRTNQKC
jgi:hypothetical protein